MTKRIIINNSKTTIAIRLARKKYLFLFLGYIFLASSCSLRLSPYLKPNVNKPIIYHYSFIKPNDGFYKRIESIFGSVGKGDTITGEMEIVYKTIEINGEQAFFAIDIQDTIRKNPSIGPTHFLNSVMIFSKDSILLASIYRKNELNYLKREDFDCFIPPRVKRSDTLVFVDKAIPNNKKKLFLYGFRKETVSLNHSKLKNCIAITVAEKWPDTYSTSKVWLHKKYGVVKWIRSTGRIEEIDLMNIKFGF